VYSQQEKSARILPTKHTAAATPKTKFPAETCDRCRRPAPQRGRMTATLEDEQGRKTRKFICRECVAQLGAWSALAKNAEAAERAAVRMGRAA
jgi:hypothetical protein